MLKVGLTGGFACGKSFVGEALVQLGCHLIQADRLGYEVTQPGGEAYDAVIREFGTGILKDDGTIDRKRLAAEVFDDADRLAVLNSLVHPPVFRREAELLAQFEAADPRGIAVVEAAILIEAGTHKNYDRLIVVVCDQEQQIERAMQRTSACRQEVLARIRRQIPLEEKRKYADYVIDTSGDKESTLIQTNQIFECLRRIANET